MCAEAARCWQGSDIRPVALNSLCHLSQGNIDAPIMLFVALRVAHQPLFQKLHLIFFFAVRHVRADMWSALAVGVFVFFHTYASASSWSSCGEMLCFCIIRPLPKVDQEAELCRQRTGNCGGGGGGCRDGLKYEANREDK